MNKLIVTYANGSTEEVSSELSAEAYLDSRFGGLPEDVLAKCSVEDVERPVAKNKAKK